MPLTTAEVRWLAGLGHPNGVDRGRLMHIRARLTSTDRDARLVDWVLSIPAPAAPPRHANPLRLDSVAALMPRKSAADRRSLTAAEVAFIQSVAAVPTADIPKRISVEDLQALARAGSVAVDGAERRLIANELERIAEHHGRLERLADAHATIALSEKVSPIRSLSHGLDEAGAFAIQGDTPALSFDEAWSRAAVERAAVWKQVDADRAAAVAEARQALAADATPRAFAHP